MTGQTRERILLTGEVAGDNSGTQHPWPIRNGFASPLFASHKHVECPNNTQRGWYDVLTQLKLHGISAGINKSLLASAARQ